MNKDSLLNSTTSEFCVSKFDQMQIVQRKQKNIRLQKQGQTKKKMVVGEGFRQNNLTK